MAPVFTGNWFGFGRSSAAGGPTGPTAQTPLGHDASGGVISEYTTPPGAVYRSHTFNSPGNFVVSALSESYPAHVEYVLVGGGGSGGGDRGGGGGGGGVRTNSPACEIGGPGQSKDPSTNAPVSAQSYAVVIQTGGSTGSYPQPATGPSPTGNSDGTPANPAKPAAGNRPHTSALGVSVSGGGGGGSGGGGGPQGTAGQSMPGPLAGSSGGSVWPNWPPTAGGPYGWKGGEGDPGGSLGAGGGGGAQKEGDKGQSNSEGGEGGTGAECTMQGPNCEIELGAGGGGGDNGSAGGYGGSPTPFYPSGWGGAGFPDPVMTPQGPAAIAWAGVAGSGGGGGGANNNAPVMSGGPGASGTCIIRYQIQASNNIKYATKATGGQVSYYNNKIIHTFLYNGNFVTTSAISGAEVFIVGAGGGGAGNNGGSGGGGAGGAAKLTNVTFGSPATFTVTVGRGGRGGAVQNTSGIDGQPSTITGPGPALTATITGKGGGGGIGWNKSDAQGRSGGCGGGSALAHPPNSSGDTGGATIQSTANPGWPAPQLTSYGYAGGAYDTPYRGGGGGGLGAVGRDGNASPDPSRGGIGIQLPTTFQDPRAAQSHGMEGPGPTWYWVGGGGPGGSETGNPTGPTTNNEVLGGIGGGGQQGGAPTFWRWHGAPGIANTGGGGGAGWWDSTGGSGGDGGTGLVLIAYPDPDN